MKIIDEVERTLFISASTIQGAGAGLFAGNNIQKGRPVCEYKGDIFEDYEDLEKSGRYNYTLQMGIEKTSPVYSITHEHTGKVIDSHPAFSKEAIGLGGFINDSLGPRLRMKQDYVDSVKELTLSFDNQSSVTSLTDIDKTKDWKIKMGFNVTAYSVPNEDKIIMMSLRDIKGGEEIFFDYGDNYWLPYVKLIAKQNQMKNKQEEEGKKTVPVMNKEDFDKALAKE